MTLQEFTSFALTEKAKFQERLNQKAKKINLREILAEVELVFPSQEGFNYRSIGASTFVAGMELKYSICNHRCEVRVNSAQLSLNAFEINPIIFSGSHVKSYYTKLASRVLKAQEDYLINLPF